MPDFPETDHSLIARVKDLADGTSLSEFLGIYQPIVFRMARRRGMQDADAHDVMQKVFVSIAQSIQRWTAQSGQPPFLAWLTTVARNAITKALTRRPFDEATGSPAVLDLLEGHADTAATTSELLDEGRRGVVRWATDQIRSEFSTETWKIFWQTAIEGISNTYVAAATGRSRGAIAVARFAHEDLTPIDLQKVEEHVSECMNCRALLQKAEPDPDWVKQTAPILSETQKYSEVLIRLMSLSIVS